MNDLDPKIAAAINGENGEAEKAGTRNCLMNRRQFLLTSGITTTVVMVGIPGMPQAQTPAVVSTYQRKFIAKLSELVVDEPFDFEYPDSGEYAESILVKLGKEAGGGLGPNRDVVAFNYTCTHQGGPLQGTYQAADKALGPCPLHLTTFDLTRHGIFISGQAYQSLPQVLLELDGDDIYAVGMFGLIYGRFDNLQG
ncbi:arsenite oxidase small subunit [Litoreibacter ascidiaceicola]|uniref:Arsenite oxidase small subunit n=1 Tax=Litoreibacter ascidiaceicola TaxID=1486859 RepID=A0A1M5B1H5_9RHOB|nr:arsenate reductase (azurin) small subunit [Litoreibacter ascidiaceicola]SHF36309.1 arsenite oxidase small subunit [Litoreibacter ascidiaceicola]